MLFVPLQRALLLRIHDNHFVRRQAFALPHRVHVLQRLVDRVAFDAVLFDLLFSCRLPVGILLDDLRSQKSA